MKYMNNEKREELGWQTNFEVYTARKSNKLVRCGLPENWGSPVVKKVSKPTKMISLDLKNYSWKQEYKHLIPTKGLEKVEYFRKKNKCSVCKINQKVLVRYGRKGKKAPKNGTFSLEKLKKSVNMISTKI